jgi:hypothetical protein
LWSRLVARTYPNGTGKRPHRSARSSESIELVHADVDYQVKAGFANIVPWTELEYNMPLTLKISPLAVVPQQTRRGRMILDLPFAVHKNGTTTRLEVRQ